MKKRTYFDVQRTKNQNTLLGSKVKVKVNVDLYSALSWSHL